MTAKWGKISFGCFIFTLALSTLFPIILFFYIDEPRYPLTSFLFAVILLSPLNLIGAILAFLGGRKKETPRIYPWLGLILNLIIAEPILLYIVYFSIF